MHMSNHANERTRVEHTFLAVVHSAYGAIRVARAVRTDIIKAGSIGQHR